MNKSQGFMDLMEAPTEPSGFMDFMEPRDRKTIGTAFKEVREDPASLVPYVSSAIGIVEDIRIYEAVLAAEKGAETPEQFELIRNYIEEGDQPTSLGYDVASTLLHMLPFAGEMLTGGGLATQAGKKVISKGIREAVERKVAAGGAKAVLARTARGAAKTAGTVGINEAISGAAGSLAQGELVGGRIHASTLRAALPALGLTENDAGRAALIFQGSTQSFLEALPEGLADQLIEVGSEFSGAALGRLGGALLKRVPGMDAVVAGQSKVFEFLAGKLGKEEALKRLASVGWHGPVQEYLEEIAGFGARAGLAQVPGMEGLQATFPGLGETIAIFAAGALLPAASAGLDALNREDATAALVARTPEEVEAAADALIAQAGPAGPSGPVAPEESRDLGGPAVTQPSATNLEQGGAEVKTPEQAAPGQETIPGMGSSPESGTAVLASREIQGEDLPASELHTPEPSEVSPGPRSESDIPIGRRMRGRLEPLPEPQEGEPVSIPQVADVFSKAIETAGGKTPIRSGRVRGKGAESAAGIFKVKPEVIRIRRAGDLVTIAHETAHALEKHIYGVKGNPALDKTMEAELDGLLSEYGEELEGPIRFREGWAEFVRYWTTTDQAATKAPKTTAWFEKTFAAEQPEVFAQLQKAKALTTRWRMQGSMERGDASLIEPPSLPERVTRGAKKGLNWRTLNRLWVEGGAPLAEVSEEAARRSGKPLPITEDPYALRTALSMTHSARVAHMAEKGMIDLAGNRVGPALQDAATIVGTGKGNMRRFVLYLWARRTKALYEEKIEEIGENELGEPTFKVTKRKRESGMSQQDADQIIRELETPAFQRAAEIVYQWNEGVLDYLAQASPEFARVVERIRETDPGSYIPLQREFDELDTAARRAGAGGSPFQRLKGSLRRIRDPFPQMIANAERRVLAAHRRMVVDALRKASRIEGMGWLLERVPKDKVPVATRSIADLAKEIERVTGEEVELDEEQAEELITIWAPARVPKQGEEAIVPFYENGETVWYSVDPELYRSLLGMDVYRLPKLLDLTFGAPTRFFRAGTTGLRASFGLLTNPLRDVQTFYMNSTHPSVNPFRALGHYLRHVIGAGMHASSGGKLSNEWLDTWQALGGPMAQPLGQDIPHTARTARRMFQGRAVRTLDPRNVYDFIRDFLQFPESAGRIAELQNVAKDVAWAPGQEMTLEQSLRMLTGGKQVTVDFTAGGDFARVMNQIVPFFNAAIQGPRSAVRAFRRDPGKFLLRGLTGIAFPTLALWYLNRDEDWWDEIPLDERHLYWWIPVEIGGRSEIVRIPRSFDAGMFFGALPEAMIDAAYKRDPEVAESWIGQMVETGNPLDWPPALKTQVELLANKDLYFDRPIDTAADLRKEPSERYSDYTTQAGIIIGSLFDVSPKKVDHAIRGLGGPVSIDLLSLLGLGPEGVDREDEPADALIVGRMFHRGGELGSNLRSVEELYATLEAAQRIQASDTAKESPVQRQLRLMLDDAQAAVSSLSSVRAQTAEVDKRRALTRSIRTIARDAVSAYAAGEVRRGEFKFQRKSTQRLEDVTEAR